MYAEGTVRNVDVVCRDEEEVEMDAFAFKAMVCVAEGGGLRDRNWRYSMDLVRY